MGVPFEARRVTIAKSEHLQSDYLTLNPRARVPLLLADGARIRELSAILTWLGQQCGLYPPAGSLDAARCGEWLAWMTSGVHISFGLIWRGERFSRDAADYERIKARGYEWLDEQFGEIDTALKDRPFVLGETYSVADANLLPFYRWGHRVGLDMQTCCPNWTAHTRRMLARPAVITALEAEGVDIWEGASH